MALRVEEDFFILNDKKWECRWITNHLRWKGCKQPKRTYCGRRRATNGKICVGTALSWLWSFKCRCVIFITKPIKKMQSQNPRYKTRSLERSMGDHVVQHFDSVCFLIYKILAAPFHSFRNVYSFQVAAKLFVYAYLYYLIFMLPCYLRCFLLHVQLSITHYDVLFCLVCLLLYSISFYPHINMFSLLLAHDVLL